MVGFGAPGAFPESENEDPKLCPPPEPDTPHGSSERAKDYEDDVHARVNPQAPIPRGFGVNLPDPVTEKRVYFEDCFQVAGDLIDRDMQRGDLAEAKGLGFEWLMAAGGDKRTKTLDDFATKLKGNSEPLVRLGVA